MGGSLKERRDPVGSEASTVGKDPTTLPSDIFDLLESGDHEVSEENVLAAGHLFTEMLRNRFTRREEKSGEAVLRFSSLGKQDRQLWYQANVPEKAEKLNGKTLFKFLYGDAIEILLIFLAKESGHEVTHEQYEVEIDGVKGHTDCVIDGIPVDVKSASPYSFQKFETGEFVFNDVFGYIPQLSGYATMLDKTDRAGFLVANKVDGGIAFAELDEYTIKNNHPRPRIAELRSVINESEAPPRCYPLVADGKSGNKKLGVNCSYCPFKYECYKDTNDGQGLRKFYYSRGPIFLAETVREPNVKEASVGDN
jgi:hypothetical protein